MPQITIVLQYKIFIKNSAGAAEKFRRACAFNYTEPPAPHFYIMQFAFLWQR